jgi:predicted nucleic acid-binding protein
MTVVADSTACIYLARLGDLGILQKLFGRIVPRFADFV